MSGVCDVHTAMLQNIMNKLKKKQLLQFNKDLNDLVNQMDLLEEYLQDSVVQEQIDEIFMGLCEKYQVTVTAVFIRILVIQSARSRIHLASYYRFYTGLFARLIEIYHAKHGAMVCNCARIHTELLYI